MKPPAKHLEIEDLVLGTGPVAEGIALCVVHFTGWLDDGTEFETSRTSGRPFTFELNRRRVIPGWDAGINGMRVGGKRRLRIPPFLAYGKRGYPPVIPPDATLVFEIELVRVER